ncbi:MAG: DUF58 domain-containing protein [Gammaproteobacteria bacterium]|nr:DUF58 domain-containing protein [Gammaproteobacteria bacterium]
MKQPAADDITRIRQSTLISLNREAKNLPLTPGKITAKLSGAYLTIFKGLGMEFDEVRPYQAGDDLYSIDWNVTARTGEAHTKVFREERERPVLMWVDYRQPMFFGTRGSFKSVVAAKTAALLAWSTAQHGDRLGGLIFSENQHDELRPLRGKTGTLHFIHRLSNHSAWDEYQQNQQHAGKPYDIKKAALEQSAAQALHRLRRVTHSGSLIFLISDFRHFNSLAESYLAAMSCHNDVVMINIHDPLESRLPSAGHYRFSNSKTNIDVDTHNQKTCDDYQQQFIQRQQYLKNMCRRMGMFYLSISTADELVSSLQSGLGLKR